MRKNIKDIFAYIYFFPLSLIIAIIVSGTFSILQNLFNYISCKFSLLPVWFLSNYTACNGVYNKRTFLADVVFFFLFVNLIEYYIPNYKKIAKIIITILSIILIGIILFNIISLKIFDENILNVGVLFIVLIIYLIIQIKKYFKL